MLQHKWNPKYAADSSTKPPAPVEPPVEPPMPTPPVPIEPGSKGGGEG